MSIDIKTVAIIGGIGFVGYQVLKTSRAIQRTSAQLNPLIANANGVAGKVNQIAGDFGAVSNAAVNVLKGLGGLFQSSGSGLNTSPVRPSSATDIFGETPVTGGIAAGLGGWKPGVDDSVASGGFLSTGLTQWGSNDMTDSFF